MMYKKNLESVRVFTTMRLFALTVLFFCCSISHIDAAKIGLNLISSFKAFLDNPDSYPFCKSRMDYAPIRYDRNIVKIFDNNKIVIAAPGGMTEVNSYLEKNRVKRLIEDYEADGYEVVACYLFKEQQVTGTKHGGPFEDIDPRILLQEDIDYTKSEIANSNLKCKNTLKYFQLLNHTSDVNTFPDNLKTFLKQFDGLGTELHTNYVRTNNVVSLKKMANNTKWCLDNNKFTFVFMGGGPGSYSDFETVISTYQYLWREMNKRGVNHKDDRIIYFRQGNRGGKFFPESDDKTLMSQMKWLIEAVQNDVPSISNIPNQIINNQPSTGDLSFTITEDLTPSYISFRLTATSSDSSIIPDANITFSGTGANRTINVKPVSGKFGVVTISIKGSSRFISYTQTFTVTVVGKEATIIDFQPIPLKYTNGEPDFVPLVFSNSNGAFVFTSSNTAVARVVNGKIQVVGKGTSVITATQATTTFRKAASSTQTLTVTDVNGQNQTINFPVIPKKVYGEDDFVWGTTSSNLPLTYSSSNLNVATIVDGKIHIQGAGTATITASQTGSLVFKAATSVSRVLEVAKVKPQLFVELIDPDDIAGVGIVPVVSTKSPAEVKYSSSNVNVIASFTTSGIPGYIILGPGTTVFTAKQDETPNYLSATHTQRVVITKRDQVISFDPFDDPTEIGGLDFVPEAESNSNLKLTFSSSNTNVATIVEGKIHIVGSGNTMITASQEGDELYNVAIPVSQTLNTVFPVVCAATINSKAYAFCKGKSLLLSASAGVSFKWYLDKRLVGTSSTYEATEGGDYTVHVTNPSGCTAISSQRSIARGDGSTSIITTTANSFCANESLTLEGIGGYDPKWFRDGVFVSEGRELVVKTAGTYTLFTVARNNCGTNSDPKIITENPLPLASISSPSDVFCAGKSLKLIASSGGASYLWFKGVTQVGATQNYTATVAGSYEVEVTSDKGCKAKSSVKNITTDENACLVSGIENEFSTTPEVSIYPNPSQDGLFNLSQTANWKVSSLLSDELKSGNCNQINLLGYPKGVYLVKVGGKVERVVVE